MTSCISSLLMNIYLRALYAFYNQPFSGVKAFRMSFSARLNSFFETKLKEIYVKVYGEGSVSMIEFIPQEAPECRQIKLEKAAGL